MFVKETRLLAMSLSKRGLRVVPYDKLGDLADIDS